MPKAVPWLCILLVPAVVLAHGAAQVPAEPDEARRIVFPDTPEYLTLAVDLHTHSAFSDGHVWPKIRVEEALRDGLAGIAFTEHLEWQPHLEDIPHPDRNRAFEIGRESAEGTGLVVINGSEITREMPVGHINAVFIEDANKLYRVPRRARNTVDADGYYAALGEWPASEALAAAHAQGAFLFWNHPAWTEQAPDGIARATGFHIEAIERGYLHGIEIVNVREYSEEAFAIALEHGLALIGTSDVHELIDWDYRPGEGGHRPVTLVFSEERSAKGIRDGLFARRTVVWFENLLFGREEHLLPLIEASLSAGEAQPVPGTATAAFTLSNRSDARYLLESRGDYTFLSSGRFLEVPPHETLELSVADAGGSGTLEFEFVVRNAYVSPRQNAVIRLEIPVIPR